MKTPRTSRVYAWEGVSEASGASGLCEREAYLRHIAGLRRIQLMSFTEPHDVLSSAQCAQLAFISLEVMFDFTCRGAGLIGTFLYELVSAGAMATQVAPCEKMFGAHLEVRS